MQKDHLINQQRLRNGSALLTRDTRANGRGPEVVQSSKATGIPENLTIAVEVKTAPSPTSPRQDRECGMTKNAPSKDPFIARYVIEKFLIRVQ